MPNQEKVRVWFEKYLRESKKDPMEKSNLDRLVSRWMDAMEHGQVAMGQSLRDADIETLRNFIFCQKRKTFRITPLSPMVHTSAPPTPPQRATKFLYFFLPNRLRENVIGDLAEEFSEKMLPKLGPTGARWWFWKEAIFAIVALAFSGLIKIFERIRKSS